MFEKLLKNWQNNYFEVKEVILTDVKAQNYDKLDVFLEVYQKLDAEQKSKMPGLIKDLKQILKTHSAAGDEEAARRLKLL